MKHLFFLLLLSSCQPAKESTPADEYVLIEFASKLEEDYEKNGGAALKSKIE